MQLQAKEFAEILDLDIKTFNYQCKKGRIPKHDKTIGRSRLWEEETIIGYLNSKKHDIDLKIIKLGGKSGR